MRIAEASRRYAFNRKIGQAELRQTDSRCCYQTMWIGRLVKNCKEINVTTRMPRGDESVEKF